MRGAAVVDIGEALIFRIVEHQVSANIGLVGISNDMTDSLSRYACG